MRACCENPPKSVPNSLLERLARQNAFERRFLRAFKLQKRPQELSGTLFGGPGAFLDSLGRSWGALGALLGALGPLLGALGTLLGAAGTLLGRSLTPLGDLGSILAPPRVGFGASEGRFWILLASISSDRNDDSTPTTLERRERQATTMQRRPEWRVHCALLESSSLYLLYLLYI